MSVLFHEQGAGQRENDVRVRRGSGHRAGARRQAPGRPPGRRRDCVCLAPVAHGRGLGVTACSPSRAPRRAPSRVLLLAGAGIAMFVFVLAFGLAAGQGGGVQAPVPEATILVSVRPGETVWDVARTHAPESDPRAVVRRIQELNRVDVGSVDAGAVLAVPVGGLDR